MIQDSPSFGHTKMLLQSNLLPSKLRQYSNCAYSIVFVHGLQGHPRNTWTCERHLEQPRGFKELLARVRKSGRKNASTPKEVFWPLHFLPEDCANTRILTWGYDSKVSQFFSGAANHSNITAYARNLLAALKIIRLSCVSIQIHSDVTLLSCLVAKKRPYIHSTFPWW